MSSKIASLSSSLFLGTSKSFGRMTLCNSCQDLNVYHLRIAIDQLHEGVAKGCAACALLQEGIGYFAEPDHDIVWLDLLVDCAFDVTVVGKNERCLYTVEFYTDIGKLFL